MKRSHELNYQQDSKEQKSGNENSRQVTHESVDPGPSACVNGKKSSLCQRVGNRNQYDQFFNFKRNGTLKIGICKCVNKSMVTVWRSKCSNLTQQD